jgi:ligand-binding SRPBCC domain-containing protein
VTQALTSKITVFDRPRHFRDEMTRSAFARLCHDHYFEPTANGTRIVDVFDFTAPLGLLGRAADRLFLARYLRTFLEERGRALKQFAESEEGSRFVSA